MLEHIYNFLRSRYFNDESGRSNQITYTSDVRRGIYLIRVYSPTFRECVEIDMESTVHDLGDAFRIAGVK